MGKGLGYMTYLMNLNIDVEQIVSRTNQNLLNDCMTLSIFQQTSSWAQKSQGNGKMKINEKRNVSL